MQPLFDVLAQLNQQERDDFTGWFAGLSQKDRAAVASVFASTTVDRVRTLLSIPAQNRVALFLVKKNPVESLIDGLKKKVDEINEDIEATGVPDALKTLNKKLLDDIKRKLS